MAVMTYQIWVDGKGRPLVQDKTANNGEDRQKCLVGIQAIAKQRARLSPFEFANELIAGELARALRLPVAEGTFIHKDRDRWYASFNFNTWAPEALPKLIPFFAKRIVSKKPEQAAGIVAFDMWVCNHDRHERNIAWNDDAEQVFIFDQGEALFVTSRPRRRLERIAENRELGVGNHCLLTHLTNLETLYPWFQKIREIPETFLRSLITEAEQLGLPKSDGDFLAEFLLERRNILASLLADNIMAFRGSTDLYVRTMTKKLRVRRKKRTAQRTAAIVHRGVRPCRECEQRLRRTRRNCK